MTHEQMVAWLILEGHRPYTQDGYWVVTYERIECVCNHGQTVWSVQSYTEGCDDRPIDWSEIPSQTLMELYPCMMEKMK